MAKRLSPKSNKWLLGVAAGSIAVISFVAYWRHALDAIPQVDPPSVTLPSPNAHDYYFRAAKALFRARQITPGVTEFNIQKSLTLPGAAPPQELASLAAKIDNQLWLRNNTHTLKLIRTGFKHRYWAPVESMDDDILNDAREFRGLCRLLTLESREKGKRGDWVGANQSALDALYLGHHTARGAPLKGYLVAVAMRAIARTQLQAIIPHLDAATARATARRVEELEAQRIPLGDAFEQEKYNGQREIVDIMKDRNWRFELAAQSDNSKLPGISLKLRRHLYSNQRIMNNFTEYVDACIEASRAPYLGRSLPAIPDDPITPAHADVYQKLFWHVARAEAGQKTLVLQLALHAYKLEHGRFPAKLDLLVRSYLKQIPADPYGGGEPLRYRTERDTYVLYSIGPDGHDDNGKPILDPSKPDKTVSGGGARYLTRAASKGDFVANLNR